MNVKLLSAILLLALASMACGFTYDLPERIEPGPDVQESISVPVTGSDEETHLDITFGAGTLYLTPGNGGLVEGTVVYNIPQFKPEITNTKNSVEIKQGEFNDFVKYNDIKNDWDLTVGNSPIDLSITAGGYQGRYELGGLALTGLSVKDGASDVELSFSEPNKAEMSVMRYETGASSVTLTGLANANFSTLIFTAGAGNYELDFSGELMDDATVNIEAGAGDVQLIIPKGMNARITIDGALLNVNHSSSWNKTGGSYVQYGDGPRLTIIVKMAAGNLTITD